MKIKTVCTWDDELWQEVSPLYIEAFGDKGAKPVKIINNMFAQGIAELHVGYNKSGAEQALSLFTDDLLVIKEGASYLKIVAFAFIPFSFMFIITRVLRGAGDMLWGLILTAASLWAVRVPAVYILANYLGADGIWYGMALSFVLAFVITGVYTGKRKHL